MTVVRGFVNLGRTNDRETLRCLRRKASVAVVVVLNRSFALNTPFSILTVGLSGKKCDVVFRLEQ